MTLLWMDGYTGYLNSKKNFYGNRWNTTQTNNATSGGPYGEAHADGINGGSVQQQWSLGNFNTTNKFHHGLNLLNGDAESSVNNWTVESGGLTIRSSGVDPGVDPKSGSFYFYGSTFAQTTVRQDVTIPSSLHAGIDAGGEHYAAYMFGYQNSNAGLDDGRFIISCRSSSGADLSTGALALSAPTSWTEKALQLVIPPLTRTLRFKLDFQRDSGTDNNAYFDNVAAWIIQDNSSRRILMHFHGRPVTNGSQFDLMSIADEQAVQKDHITFWWETSDNLRVARGVNTTIVTSTTGTFTRDVWHHFEMDLKIGNTDGHLLIYMDGSTTPLINSTGIDTYNGSATDTFNMRARSIKRTGTGSNAREWDMANFFVMSTDGDHMNALTGERRIVGLFPNNDATASDWVISTASTETNNYEVVDDSIHEGSTDYVLSDSTGDLDLYTITDLSVRPAAIDAVQVKATFDVNTKGTNQVALMVQSGTDFDESTMFGQIGPSQIMFHHPVDSDPAASSTTGWTLDAIQNLKIGVRHHTQSTRGI